MNHLKIGAMAKACNVTPRALRFYQQEGILQPEFVDEESGYRSYSIAQSVKVDMIVQLQNAGFTLKEIADMQSREASAICTTAPQEEATSLRGRSRTSSARKR